MSSQPCANQLVAFEAVSEILICHHFHINHEHAAVLSIAFCTFCPHTHHANLLHGWALLHLLCCTEASKLRGGKTFNVAYSVRMASDKYRSGIPADKAWLFSSMFAFYADSWKGLMGPDAWARCCARFKRGGLDSELSEKSLLLPETLSAAEWRFLASFGVDDAMPEAASEAALDAAATQVQENMEGALYAESELTLQREQARFQRFKEAERKHDCASIAARAAFKKSETERNDKIVQHELETRFPVRLLTDVNGMHSSIQKAIGKWLGEESEHHDIHQVWYINLLVSGSKFQQAAATAMGKAIDSIVLKPATTMMVVVMPNCGRHGDVMDEEGAIKAEEEVLSNLGGGLGIKKKRVVVTFDESTISEQSKRLGTHMVYMVISSQTTADGKRLLSDFSKSKLWLRATVPNVPMQGVKDQVNPAAKFTLGDFEPATDLSTATRRKQHMSGWKLLRAIQERVWSGVGLTNAQKAVWIDTHSFCGSPQEMVLRGVGQNGPKVPQEMIVSLVWAPTDLEGGQKSWPFVASFLETSMQATLEDLLREKQYHLPGYEVSDWRSDDPAPQIRAADFKATFPTTTGFLALRADWVKDQEDRIKTCTLREKLTLLWGAHNTRYNPSGANFAGAEGRKRGATEQGQRPDAIELKDDELTREAVLAEFTDAVVLESLGQEWIFTHCGKLFCHGLQDDILPTDEPIARVLGTFFVGSKYDQFMSKGNVGWSMSFSSGDDEVLCTVDNPGAEGPFPAQLKPLKEFLLHLQNANLKVGVECHKLEIEFPKNDVGDVVEVKVKISNTVGIVLQPKLPEQAADIHCAASLLLVGDPKAWGPQMNKHSGGNLRVMPSLRYRKSRQFTGVAPAKPGIYASRPIRVVAGTVRQWA